MTAVFGRTRLMGFGLLAVSFIAGALSGAAVERILSAEEPQSAEERDARRDRRDRSYIIDRVDMSGEQREDIDAILERRSERMRAVWREVEPRMDAITDSARAEIMQVLTPEQRAEYERRLEKWRDRDGRGRRYDRDGEPDDSVPDNGIPADSPTTTGTGGDS